MGKRLTRISAAQISKSLPQIVGVEVSIVLLTGASFYGIVSSIENGTCFFKDLRDFPHLVSIDQISEIITDQVSSY